MEKWILKVTWSLVVAVFGFVIPYADTLASPYTKYAGTTLVVHFPAHAYYDAATKLIPEFTKETGIKVQVDKVEYMRMRDKQLLELSKPKGEYDIVSYVCMWKTEYVSKGMMTPLAPFFTNPKVSNPSYDIEDFVPAYLAIWGWLGGKKDTCLDREQLFMEFLSGRRPAFLLIVKISSTNMDGKSPKPMMKC